MDIHNTISTSWYVVNTIYKFLASLDLQHHFNICTSTSYSILSAGMLYVPIGYSNPSLFSEELHGGSPYGAGTYAGSDGSRQPSTLELGVAETEGQYFAQIATALKIGRQHKTSNTQV